jgi:hypothetical protein
MKLVRYRTFALAASLSLTLAVAYGKEGADQYPYGAENWLTGALPPPGTYFVNYLGYYSGQLRNDSGNKVNLDGSAPSVRAAFDALRFVEITHVKIFGAQWGMQVIAPFVDQSVNLGGTRGRIAQGDVDVDPFLLGWHGESWHAIAAMDTLLPTGSYDKNDARVSIGSNYYSFEPIFAFTFLPSSGWETSAKLMYNTKTTNPATSYHSGDEFHMDYVAGKHIGRWSVGASGYFMEQLTNDTVNGSVATAVPGFWGAGREGRVLGIGPSVTYRNRRHMEFIAQWQEEVLVRNRFGGNKLWFKMIIPL